MHDEATTNRWNHVHELVDCLTTEARHSHTWPFTFIRHSRIVTDVFNQLEHHRLLHT